MVRRGGRGRQPSAWGLRHLALAAPAFVLVPGVFPRKPREPYLHFVISRLAVWPLLRRAERRRIFSDRTWRCCAGGGVLEIRPVGSSAKKQPDYPKSDDLLRNSASRPSTAHDLEMADLCEIVPNSLRHGIKKMQIKKLPTGRTEAVRNDTETHHPLGYRCTGAVMKAWAGMRGGRLDMK